MLLPSFWLLPGLIPRMWTWVGYFMKEGISSVGRGCCALCGLHTGGHCKEKEEEEELIHSLEGCLCCWLFSQAEEIRRRLPAACSTTAVCFHFLTLQFLEISAFPEHGWSMCTTAELSMGLKSPWLLLRQWTRTASSLLPVPEKPHVHFYMHMMS